MFEKIFGKEDEQYYLEETKEVLAREFRLFEKYVNEFYKKKRFLEVVKAPKEEHAIELQAICKSTLELLDKEKRTELKLRRFVDRTKNLLQKAISEASPSNKPALLKIKNI